MSELKNSMITKRAYSRSLDSEVREENESSAFPLLCWRWDLVRLKFPLAEVRDSVDNNPGDGTSKVDKLYRNRRRNAVRGFLFRVHV